MFGPLYRDRVAAGRALGAELARTEHGADLLVLALPRGGLPVALEVAHALDAPLDLMIVRKLGVPDHEELALGAIASGGVRVMNPLPGLTVAPEAIARVVAREQAELVRRELLYRGGSPAVAVRGRTVIVVDDGLATGSTMRAAVLAIRQQHPARLVVAVPVGAAETCAMLGQDADEVVCAAMPSPFHAVGLWYRDFPQASDGEVRELLDEAHREHEAMTH